MQSFYPKSTVKCGIFFELLFETEVPLLVYEFIPNGIVYAHINDQSESLMLTWKTRLRIEIEVDGVLTNLCYTASTPIIHIDVNSTNILLDRSLTTKGF